jgi:hypothetical protein
MACINAGRAGSVCSHGNKRHRHVFHDGLQVAGLDIAFGTGVLKAREYSVECLFEFHIDVIFDEAAGEVLVVNRRKEFLE